MATSTGVLAEERVVFDCPVCGVHHDGPLTITVESESMDWEVGPPVETISAFVRQTMMTSACGDVFVTRSITDEPTFEMTLLSYGDDRPMVLQVVPTYEGADHDAA